MRNALFLSVRPILPLLLFGSTALSLQAGTIVFNINDDSFGTPLTPTTGTVTYDGGTSSAVIGIGLAVQSIAGELGSFDCPGGCTLDFQSGPLPQVLQLGETETAWGFDAGGSFELKDSSGTLLKGTFLPIGLGDPWNVNTAVMVDASTTGWFLEANATVDPSSFSSDVAGLSNIGPVNSGFLSLFGTTLLDFDLRNGNSFRSDTPPVGIALFMGADVPEPSAFSLFGAGLLGLVLWGFGGRRR